MKNISNYPELSSYVTKLVELTNTLTKNRDKVTTDMVAGVVNSAAGVNVTAILDKCKIDVLMDKAETTKQWFDNIHQAESALSLCKLLEATRLIKVVDEDKDRWLTPKIEAVN